MRAVWFGRAMWSVPLVAGLAAMTAGMPARAFDFGNAQWTGALRTTLSLGTAIRTSGRHASLIPTGDGAHLGVPARAAGGANTDDGNLNYKKGDVVSTVAKALVDLEIAHRAGFGAMARTALWYDYTQRHQGVPFGNLPNGYRAGARLSDDGFAEGAKFRGARLADAYVWGRITAAGMPLTAKFGQQTLDWGTPLTIPGSLRDLNPRDLAALARPGVLAEEAWLPVLALTATLEVTPQFQLDAFYQFLWRPTTLAGCGTYTVQTDYLSPGCDKVFVSNTLSAPQSLATGRWIGRAADRQPGNGGQFGVGAGYTVQGIGTRFGAYYTNVHARDGYIGAIKTTRVGQPLLPSDPDGGNPRYSIGYPESIQSATATFTTAVPSLGVRMAGEFTHRFNQPVQVSTLDMLTAFISRTGLLAADYAALAPGERYSGSERFHVTQGQAGLSKAVAGLIEGGTLTLGGEAGFKYVHGLPDHARGRYGGTDVSGYAPALGICPTTGSAATSCSNNGFVTSMAWGYRLQAVLNLTDVLPGLDVRPAVVFVHDVDGWSYDGVFNEGRKVVRLSLDGVLRKRYGVNVTYQTTVEGRYDLRRDRDVVAVSASVRF